MDREIQKMAWSALSFHGICFEGDVEAVNQPLPIEEAIALALLVARVDGRLYVAVRNLFLRSYSEIDAAKIIAKIDSSAAAQEDREAAKRCLNGLRSKTSGHRNTAPMIPIPYFKGVPLPRHPDEDMLAAGLVMQKFAGEPTWKFLTPHLLKAR